MRFESKRLDGIVTVRDVIAALSQMPQDYRVLREDDTRAFNVDRIEIWHDQKEVIIN